MAQEQNISTQLNDLLVTRNFPPVMLDRQGKQSDSDDAKTFTFDYISSSGQNYGTMVIILDSDNDLKVFYGDNLGRAMEGNDKDEFFDFQQHLNKFANQRRWTYTAKDLNQLKHTMQGLAAIQEGLFEGYYGTRRISYAGEPTQARLMIKHNRALGEADARFRYVESLFIETADSERFKLPFKNLAGGRAMLEHVQQGGTPYDVRGVHISEMIMEIGTLSRFNRASATRVLEGSTQQLVTEAQIYYKSLRENMKRLASPRGYLAYFETWHPATRDQQQELVENIKTLFIEQTLDTRIEAALPLLARIQQQGTAMKEAEIFENWVNQMVEGTWALPETPEQENKLRELLSAELIVGPDATNATEQLYDLIGDDRLYDQLADIARQDPAADVRQPVIDRLRELGYDLSTDDVQQSDNSDDSDDLPLSEGRVLDESGETLEHILSRFKYEVAQFEQGNDLDTDLYYTLYDYYTDRGEIPYGVAKARDGDPFEWVTDRLDQELGTGNHAKRVPEADALNTFEVMSGFDAPVAEGSCNRTMEGEYCPDHGLTKCGGMTEMGTVAGGMAPAVVNQSMPEGAADPLARLKSLALRK